MNILPCQRGWKIHPIFKKQTPHSHTASPSPVCIPAWDRALPAPPAAQGTHSASVSGTLSMDRLLLPHAGRRKQLGSPCTPTPIVWFIPHPIKIAAPARGWDGEHRGGSVWRGVFFMKYFFSFSLLLSSFGVFPIAQWCCVKG